MYQLYVYIFLVEEDMYLFNIRKLNVFTTVLSNMNEAQRTVLQKHHVELAHDIVVTETILGTCFQNKLFDKHLIDLIRVCNIFFNISRSRANRFSTFSAMNYVCHHEC